MFYRPNFKGEHMGHRGEDEDQLRSMAESILETTKHLEECPHGELLSTGDDDLTDAYKMASAQVLPRGRTRCDLTDMIKEVYDSSGEECYTCSKNERE
jgi:hypothetical protein